MDLVIFLNVQMFRIFGFYGITCCIFGRLLWMLNEKKCESGQYRDETDDCLE